MSLRRPLLLALSDTSHLSLHHPIPWTPPLLECFVQTFCMVLTNSCSFTFPIFLNYTAYNERCCCLLKCKNSYTIKSCFKPWLLAFPGLVVFRPILLMLSSTHDDKTPLTLSPALCSWAVLFSQAGAFKHTPNSQHSQLTVNLLRPITVSVPLAGMPPSPCTSIFPVPWSPFVS